MKYTKDHKKLPLMIMLSLFFLNPALYAVEESKFKDLNQKLQLFLGADTEKARALLSEFSSAELQEVWNDHTESKSLQEKRLLWLIEEHYLREADKVASSRLVYLFLAALLLLSMIFSFIYLGIREQKKILSKL